MYVCVSLQIHIYSEKDDTRLVDVAWLFYTCDDVFTVMSTDI